MRREHGVFVGIRYRPVYPDLYEVMLKDFCPSTDDLECVWCVCVGISCTPRRTVSLNNTSRDSTTSDIRICR